jgi:hypothetical protein
VLRRIVARICHAFGLQPHCTATFKALCSCLGRAPEPGNMGRPNAVGAFFSRWRQWQAEVSMDFKSAGI